MSKPLIAPIAKLALGIAKRLGWMPWCVSFRFEEATMIVEVEAMEKREEKFFSIELLDNMAVDQLDVLIEVLSDPFTLRARLKRKGLTANLVAIQLV